MEPKSDMRSIRTRVWRLPLLFLLISFVVVAGVNSLVAMALAEAVSRESLERDAEVLTKYIVGIAEIEGLEAGLQSRATMGQLLDDRVDPAVYGVDLYDAALSRAEFLGHMLSLPDTLRVNIMGRDRVVVWSTDPDLIGRRNDPDAELDQVFASRRAVTNGYWNAEREGQGEEALGYLHDSYFVETYIPLTDAKGEVATVVEVYREPGSIIAGVHKYHHLVWVGTGVVTLVVCLALLVIVRSFDKLVRTEEQRRADNERLILVGEMSTAVAHGLRSPMAAIRSSAELALDGDAESARKNACDIIQRVDQMNVWLRELLTFTQPATGETEALDIKSVLDDALRAFHPQFEESGVRLECELCAQSLPPVAGNARLVLQVFNNVIANALEAMPRGGSLKVAGEATQAGRRVRLVFGDTGSGMSEQQLAKLFRPFQTTKRNGLGFGMPMTKRIMERSGGSVQVRSRENGGTEVELDFEAAR